MGASQKETDRYSNHPFFFGVNSLLGFREGTPWKINGWNLRIQPPPGISEKHLNQTIIFRFKLLIFGGSKPTEPILREIKVDTNLYGKFSGISPPQKKIVHCVKLGLVILNDTRFLERRFLFFSEISFLGDFGRWSCETYVFETESLKSSVQTPDALNGCGSDNDTHVTHVWWDSFWNH